MIEEALYEHLRWQDCLRDYLATYGDGLAVFSQEAPDDTDECWGEGPQYGRIVFAVDLQGDPERTMGGMLAVDIMCKADEDNEQYPEDIEPIIRQLIHGYFFSAGRFVVSAQWKNSAYFTEATDNVKGCTLTFDLLAFPMMTTFDPDVIRRINEWTHERFDNLYVINFDELPEKAWKPAGCVSAVYWRLVDEKPAGWIPDTYATIWRTANLRGHIFAENNAAVVDVARRIAYRLYSDKRLKKQGEAPIMVNRRNEINPGADPLRTGQLSVEATYGVIVYYQNTQMLDNINVEK